MFRSMAMPDVLLISCYSLGHQPLGIAWPKAFLERAGFAPDSLDPAVEPWDDAKVRRAKLVAIAVPMHTALRLGVRTAERIRRANPQCRIVFHGLYALLNAEYLLAGIADYVFGGEFEESFVELVEQLERRTTYDARRTNSTYDARRTNSTYDARRTDSTYDAPRTRLKFPLP